MPFLDYSFLFIYRSVPIHLLMILRKALTCLKKLFQGSSLTPYPSPYLTHGTRESPLHFIYFLNQVMFALGLKLQNAQQTGLNMEATATKRFK